MVAPASNVSCEVPVDVTRAEAVLAASGLRKLLIVTLPDRAVMSAATSTIGATSFTCAPLLRFSGADTAIESPELMLRPPRLKLLMAGASKYAVLARSDGIGLVADQLS